MGRDCSARLVLTGDTAVVEVDSVDLAAVTRSVQVHAAPGERPRLLLDLPLHQITVEGETQVAVTERVAQALISLGWAPPQPSG